MPFRLTPPLPCADCPHGYCVSYIRSQSRRMKDRDTQYRLLQNAAMACCFDSWVPGFEDAHDVGTPFAAYVDRLIENAGIAGQWLEENRPDVFGEVEESFFLTSGQRGKVRGDVLELLVRAVAWNVTAHFNALSMGDESPFADSPLVAPLTTHPKHGPRALLTLGDNYDLKQLLDEEGRETLLSFESSLKESGTSLAYSTPDLVAIDIEGLDPGIVDTFSRPIRDLGAASQSLLQSARGFLEGRISPGRILFASGIKSSIRSDRMYQFLFEANAWKFVWRKVFQLPASRYYVWVTRTYGANPEKLSSVDFTSLGGKASGEGVGRAVDAVALLLTPTDLVGFLADNW